MIKQTRTVEDILMRDRVAKWIGIKMPSKAFDDSYLLAYGRSDNMVDDEMNEIESDVDRMIDKIKKAWNERPAKTVERLCTVDDEILEQLRKIDSVDHPSYYNGDIECIDAMIQTQGVEAVKAFCLCNAFKYLWRHKGKGGDEDIEKAVWYLEKYLELGGKT